MAKKRNKPLMRNLGEFVGHIVRGVKTDPKNKVIRKDVKEEDRGSMILRRTTIDEIEFRDKRK